jgi:hypothetical protein
MLEKLYHFQTAILFRSRMSFLPCALAMARAACP